MRFFDFVWGLCHWFASDLPGSLNFHPPSSLITKKLSDYKSQQKPFGRPFQAGNCNGPFNRQEWCSFFDIDTDYEVDTPITGVWNNFTFELTNDYCNPDGYNVTCMLINGQYPGPLISGNWGDWFNITVINKLNNCNGTAIHFHGLRQWNTVWSDGVPGVTQCPIPPGGTMSYIWRATQYGASWYHSHFSLQYPDGILGPLIIYGPTTANYDFEGEALLLSDWYHKDAFSLFWEEITPGAISGSPEPQSVLINGQGNFTIPINDGTAVALGCDTSSDPQCKPELASVYHTQALQRGASYKYRIINTSADTHFTFWIDGHDFIVVATDFVPIVPYTTKVLNVAIGQRYDIILCAEADTSKSRQFWMKMRRCDHYCIGETCTPEPGNPGSCDNSKFHECRQGILRYNVPGPDSPDANSEGDPGDQQCLDASMPQSVEPVPWVPREIPNVPEELNLYAAIHGSQPLIPDDHQFEVAIEKKVDPVTNQTLNHWVLANNTFYIDWEEPTLDLIVNKVPLTRPGYAPVYLEGNDDTWQVFVIEGAWIKNRLGNEKSQIPVAHPIHLHGHDYAILYQSLEEIKPGVLYPMRIHNPPRRDVAMLPLDGFLVIAFRTDNPGPWLMHCHIAWHASGGLALQFVERQSDIPQLVANAGILPDLESRCQAWTQAYEVTKEFCPSSEDPASQEDSGV